MDRETSATEQAVDDPQRVAAVADSRLRYAFPDEGLDRITRIAGALVRAPVALVSIVDDRRQYFAGLTGLSGPYAEARETPLSHSFCREVVRKGDAVIVTDSRRDPRFRDNPAIDDLGVGAYCAVPLVTESGWRIGALCAIDNGPRDWTREDVDMLTELADLVHTEFRMRTTTRRLEELLGQEARHRDSAESVARLAIRLAPVLTSDEVIRHVGSHLESTDLAALASMAVLENGKLSIVHSDAIEAETAAEWTSVELDADIPIAVAARRGESVVIDTDDAMDAWPRLRELLEEHEVTAVGAFPLQDVAGHTIGALAVARSDNRRLAVSDLEDIAVVVGLALDRTARHEREARQARILQTALLPSQLAESPHVELVTRYAAASDESSVGRDWYDFLRVDATRHLMVVGDVSGHDIGAARNVARARHAIGALASTGMQPADILHAADRYVGTLGRVMATCEIGLYDAAEASFTVASAGHPPPIVIRRDGAVDFIKVKAGPPLVGHGVVPDELTVDLDRDDIVVFYTDGLIERRGESIDAGLRRLAETCQRVDSGDISEFADQLLAISPREDDVALLIVRVLGG